MRGRGSWDQHAARRRVNGTLPIRRKAGAGEAGLQPGSEHGIGVNGLSPQFYTAAFTLESCRCRSTDSSSCSLRMASGIRLLAIYRSEMLIVWGSFMATAISSLSTSPLNRPDCEVRETGQASSFRSVSETCPTCLPPSGGAQRQLRKGSCAPGC